MSIEIQNIEYIYHPHTIYETRALRNVSLSLRSGEILGLIGREGSGKSTLLQVIQGLLPPSQGLLSIDGMEYTSCCKSDLAKVRRNIGLVFQHPEKQIFELRVEDEIACGPRNLGLEPAMIKEKVFQSMQAMGLPYEVFADRNPHELSSGEKRRVAIASILAMAPHYLLLDEPFAGLDYEGRQGLCDYLCKVKEFQSTGILISGHDLPFLAEFCDGLLFMDEGTIVLNTEPALIVDHMEIIQNLGYDPPEHQLLMHELVQRGWQLSLHSKELSQASQEIIRYLQTGESE